MITRSWFQAGACLSPLWGRPVIGSRIAPSWPKRMCTYCLKEVTSGYMLFRHAGPRAPDCPSHLLVKPVSALVLSLEFQRAKRGHWKVDATTLAGQSVMQGGKILRGGTGTGEVWKLVEEEVQVRWTMTEPELAKVKLLHGSKPFPRRQESISRYLERMKAPKRSSRRSLRAKQAYTGYLERTKASRCSLRRRLSLRPGFGKCNGKKPATRRAKKCRTV